MFVRLSPLVLYCRRLQSLNSYTVLIPDMNHTWLVTFLQLIYVMLCFLVIKRTYVHLCYFIDWWLNYTSKMCKIIKIKKKVCPKVWLAVKFIFVNGNTYFVNEPPQLLFLRLCSSGKEMIVEHSPPQWGSLDLKATHSCWCPFYFKKPMMLRTPIIIRAHQFLLVC